MQARYFDPIGRECDAGSFAEWATDRPDLRTVRHFKNDKLEVKLVWNDRPIDSFGPMDVFKIEAIRSIDGRRSFDAELSSLSASNLTAGVALYQQVLVELGLAEKRPDGSINELGNEADPTTHELEFSVDELVHEEALSEEEVELDEPKLTPVVAVAEVPKVAKIGAGFTGMSDGADAW